MKHNASSVKLNKEGTYVCALNVPIFHPIYTPVVSIQMREMRICLHVSLIQHKNQFVRPDLRVENTAILVFHTVM